MFIPEFKNNKMQLGIIWSGKNLVQYDSANYLKWLEGIQRHHRSIKYFDNGGNKHQGFITNDSPSQESYAVYIKEMYGDGFYFCPIDESDITNGMYIVIIKDDVIMPGSDVIYDYSFFQKIDSERKNSDYSSLKKIELDENHFNEIANQYKNNMLVIQRKRRILYASLSICIAIFSIILYSVVSVIISR